MEISSAQVIAFRLAAQHVAPRGEDSVAVLRGWAVQDSPTGAAAVALAARADSLEPGWLDAAVEEERSAVVFYNPRTAAAVVPADEVATVTAGLLPRDEQELRHVLGRSIPPAGEGIGPADAVEAALPAFEAALADGPLSRDDLHAALRERLPDDLLPWCAGCRNHHARRGLLVTAGLHGRLCIAGRAGRQPLFARTDTWIGPAAVPDTVDADAAAAELLRRYLHGYGPSTPALLAAWAGISRAHARRVWALIADELVTVGVNGSVAWLHAEDVALLAGATPPRGVILLPAGDPLLLARDRDLLVPDQLAHKQVWAALNMPGLVLVDGEAAATWRGRKRAKTLAVELNAFGQKLTRRARAAVEREAERLAPHRGCSAVSLTAS